MGLDDVRLLMAVEEEFNVVIPHDAASKMYRVGDMYDWLKTHASCGIPDAEEEIWRRLVQVICNELNCLPEEVKPEASFTRDLGIG